MTYFSPLSFIIMRDIYKNKDLKIIEWEKNNLKLKWFFGGESSVSKYLLAFSFRWLIVLEYILEVLISFPKLFFDIIFFDRAKVNTSTKVEFWWSIFIFHTLWINYLPLCLSSPPSPNWIGRLIEAKKLSV